MSSARFSRFYPCVRCTISNTELSFLIYNSTPVFLYDASVVRAALTSYPPLICSITTPATAASGYNGTLTCYAPTQGGAPLTLFGYCGSTLVVFDNCTDFNLNCGTGLTTCSPFSTFQYTDLKPAIVGSSSSSRASTSKISTGTSVIGIASSSIPEKSTSPSTGPATTASISGSCSVTVMLYIEQSTTYVPNGYVAPPLGAGGVSTANGGLGGGGGGGSGNYGCTPITNTMTKSI